MRRLIVPVAALHLLFAAGTAWYALVEGFGLLDGLFMVVITLSTVGYQEVRPLDASGQIFSVLFILGGVGLMLYTAAAVVEQVVVSGLVERLGERRLSRRLRQMREHVVVCGFGRVGQEVARELGRRGETLLIVDRDREACDRARAAGHTAIQGDATEEELLERAAVGRARALIAAADSDAVNAFTVLTARALHPELSIIARAGSVSGEHRLATAGANRVISPYRIAGRRMALAATQPLIQEIVDLFAAQRPESGQLVAELGIEPDAELLAGATLGHLLPGSHRTRVLGILRAGGDFTAAPPPETALAPGDRLMVFGSEPEIREIATRLERTGGAPAGADRG